MVVVSSRPVYWRKIVRYGVFVAWWCLVWDVGRRWSELSTRRSLRGRRLRAARLWQGWSRYWDRYRSPDWRSLCHCGQEGVWWSDPGVDLNGHAEGLDCEFRLCESDTHAKVDA